MGWCWLFAKKYFRDGEGWTVRDILPSKAFLACIALARTIIWFVQLVVFGGQAGWEERVESLGRKALMDRRVLGFFGVGGVLGVACLGVWWVWGGRDVVGQLRRRGKGG